MARNHKGTTISIAPLLLEKISKFFEMAGTPYDYIYQEAKNKQNGHIHTQVSKDKNKQQ